MGLLLIILSRFCQNPLNYNRLSVLRFLLHISHYRGTDSKI
nr:MAG TPA: hypothetical protein [Caudoviricetes sp.]